MPPQVPAGLTAVNLKGYWYSLITTAEELESSVLALSVCGARKISLDLEGINLGSESGMITSLQLCGRAGGLVHVIDAVALAEADTTWFSGAFRALLEDSSMEKLMWDCRSDANALRIGYGIRIDGVIDLQLLHLAYDVMHGRTRHITGLGRALDTTALSGLSPLAQRRMAEVKYKAHRLFAPEQGGSWDIWRKRPLPPVLLEYVSFSSFLTSWC